MFCSLRNSATSPISRRDSIKLVATVRSETFQQALFEGAYAVAYLQLDVPQQGEQLADFCAGRPAVFTTEDQQIDV